MGGNKGWKRVERGGEAVEGVGGDWDVELLLGKGGREGGGEVCMVGVAWFEVA